MTTVRELEPIAPASSTVNGAGETHSIEEPKMSSSPLIAEIRETHRQRVDLMRARIRLSNQQFAVYCRLNPDDPKCQAKARERAARFQQEQTDGHYGFEAQPRGAAVLGGDYQPTDTQKESVAPSPSGNGHMFVGDLVADAVAGGVGDDHDGRGTQRISELTDFATLHLSNAQDMVSVGEKDLEKRLRKLAMQLPVWAWVEGINGFGAVGLAQIVGETGDLAQYDNPAKVWKRMGLAVINGERQRKVAGAAALDHGYNPQRRSIMWVIGDSLLKKQNAYREVYLAEKERQAELHPEHSKMQHHLRAKRYMEKRLLKDLWIAWRATGIVQPVFILPATD